MRVLSKKLVGSRSVVLAMVLSSILTLVGCGGSNSSSSGSNVTATPTFSPGAGTYSTSKPVTVADTTQGAVLYCTTDGSMPTTSSPQCAQPTTVYKTEFLQAIAVAPGQQPSTVAAAAYTITFPSAPPPTFSPAGGTYTGSQQVTISDSLSGANVYYTLDGKTPTVNSTLYTVPITISQTSTLSAVAVATSYVNSSINSATYTIQAQLPAPIVSGLSPTSANAGGAAFTVTVNGSNFVSGAIVLWNGAALTTTFVSATQLTAAVPASDIATAGTMNVAVSQPSGISGVTPFTVNSVVPTVTSLSPSSGVAGTTVTITGTNLTGATGVSFGATAATGVTVSSATSITAVAPAGTGTVNVKITTPNGTSATSRADQFTYSGPVVSGVNPSSGPLAGGTSVTITGTGFTGATGVSFGATAATGVTVNSATSITAVSPAGTSTVDVKVTTPNGTSASSSADQFAYSGPAVTGINPASGPAAGGTTVTITGTGLTGATAVNFGATAATGVSVNSATSITAVSPAGTGTVDVTVVTPNGTTATSAADHFSYGAVVPSVTTLNPTAGPIGSTVIIAGSNFGSTQGTSSVTVNGVTATTINSWSSTSISAVVPAGATTGAVVVEVNGVNSNSDQTFTVGTVVSGIVLSGTTPITGASVQLWAAGSTTGYGAGATAVGSPVTSDSKTGTFSIPYTCPASPGDLLYVVATGGSVGGGSANSGASLMTALGSCNKAGFINSVTVNEVTTVASAYSLAQFMTTAPNVGSSSTNYPGLSHAFATVGNLVDIGAGTARDHTPDYPTTFGTGDPNIVNNSTVPQARLNTLANALNTCTVNSSGCSALFTAATPASGSAPADTLQAVLNIAQNPGNNVSNIYAVATGSAAFSPSFAQAPYTGAPNDWTMALTFTGGGLGVSTSISGTDSAGTSGVGPNIATALAIDANGNVFVGGFGEYGYPYFTTYTLDIPILARFNSLGAPQTPLTAVSSAATPVITFGGDNLGEAAASEFGLGSIAIDSNGNIWAGDLYEGELFTVAPNLSLLASAASGNSVDSTAIDNQNNGWFANPGYVGEYTYSAGNSVLQQQSLAGASSQYSPSTLGLLTFDSEFNLWAYGGGAASSIYLITSDGSLVYSAYPTRGTSSNEYISMAPDNNGHVYACGDTGRTTLDVFTATSATSGIAPTTYQLGSRGCGNQLLLDGAGHLFAISNGYSRIGLDYGTVDEYTTAGVVISPAGGYTGTSTGEQPVITNDANAPLSSIGVPMISGAIDGSGNLWVINPDTSNSGGSGNSTGNMLVEFVGMAAPVVTPTVTATVNGQLGSRP